MSAGPNNLIESRVAEAPRNAVLLAGMVGLLGSIVAAAAPALAGWALTLPWVPFAGPLRLIQAVGDAVAWWLLGLVGLVVGIVAGILLHAGEPVVTVSDRAIVITKGSERIRVARSQVVAAAIEDNHLVLRDRGDVELAHEKLGGEVAAGVATALQRHGWSR